MGLADRADWQQSWSRDGAVNHALTGRFSLPNPAHTLVADGMLLPGAPEDLDFPR